MEEYGLRGFENKVLRNTARGEKFITRNFIIFIPYQILFYHIKENEVWEYVVTWVGK